MDNAEALRALDDIEALAGYMPDAEFDRATTLIVRLRAHLTDPGYVRVPVGAICKHCGNPTMHVGDVCYSCAHQRDKP